MLRKMLKGENFSINLVGGREREGKTFFQLFTTEILIVEKYNNIFSVIKIVGNVKRILKKNSFTCNYFAIVKIPA